MITFHSSLIQQLQQQQDVYKRQDWKCPWCGAGKEAFHEKKNESQTVTWKKLEKPHVEKELSAMEMSIICSNLSRGCEKQYLQDQADAFKKLADFFRSKAQPVKEANVQKLLELIETDLTVGYPYGNACLLYTSRCV